MDLNYETTFKKYCLRYKTTLHKNYKLEFKKNVKIINLDLKERHAK